MANPDDPKPPPLDSTLPTSFTTAGSGTPETYTLDLRLGSVPADRYEIEGEQGRGGIGVVLRARDRHLDRLVAIKQLQHGDDDARDRFEREMLVTARLQHPGVVPVHEAGRLPSGEPYYAMKLIEGHSLRELIASAGDMDARLALVPHVLAVADAVAYAHSRGVVHRDLKPANVIVGNFGETVVIDWGLAKVVGERDAPASTSAATRAVIADGLTMTGAVLGTPAYMPPEQARGEEVDARADVWALGAVLYHVLAGRPPYEGQSSAEVLQRVRDGAPPSLDSRVEGAPPDLVAIVTKATSSDASSRYPSCKEMADDLRRFSTGQLVSARVYSSSALFRRWLARHRATVLVASALLAALAITGGVSVARIVRERDRAEAERRLATTHRDAAEKLVEFMVSTFRDRVRAADRLDLIVGIGAEVAAYYRQLDAAGVVSDPGSLLRRATAIETLGQVESDKKQMASARTLYRTALDLRERAATERPPSAAELVSQSMIWQAMGTIDHEQGNLDEALAALDRAFALAERAARQDPASIDAHLAVALCLERSSDILQFRKGDLQGAFDKISRARDLLTPVLVAHPGTPRVESKLAKLHYMLHLTELYLGRLEDAARSIGRSLELYESAMRREPDNATLVRSYAGALSGLAGVDAARGRLTDAIAAKRRSRERLEAIAAQDSENRATERDLGWSYAEECEMLRRALLLDEARAACDQSARIFRGHIENDPKSRGSRDALINSLLNVARVETVAARAVPARAAATEAVELSRELVAADGDTGRWREDLALSLLERGKLEVELGNGRDALAVATEAVTVLERLAADSPGNLEAASTVSEGLLLLGDARLAGGERDAARALYERALGPLEAVAAKSPAIVFFQARLAKAQAKLAAAQPATASGSARAGELRRAALAGLDQLATSGRLSPEDDRLRAAVSKATQAAP